VGFAAIAHPPGDLTATPRTSATVPPGHLGGHRPLRRGSSAGSRVPVLRPYDAPSPRGERTARTPGTTRIPYRSCSPSQRKPGPSGTRSGAFGLGNSRQRTAMRWRRLERDPEQGTGDAPPCCAPPRRADPGWGQDIPVAAVRSRGARLDLRPSSIAVGPSPPVDGAGARGVQSVVGICGDSAGGRART
jgi:hypothetical protein